MKWTLLFLSTLLSPVFAESFGQRHYQQGSRQDYYRPTRLQTQQGYRGASQSQCFPDGRGGYVCQHTYNVGAGYQAANPQGMTGSGSYGADYQKTQTYPDAKTAEILSNSNAETGKRMTSLAKSMSRLDEASLVIAEEGKKFSLPNDFIQSAQNSLSLMKDSLKRFKEVVKGARVANNDPLDEALKIRNRLKDQISQFPENSPERQAAQRVYEKLADTIHYAVYTGVFWNEFGE